MNMILYSNWRNLPLHVRAKISEVFSIPKKHPTHVQDNVVIADGYDVKDIDSALTMVAMQKYTELPKETDINILWEAVVGRAEGRLPLKEEPVVPPLSVHQESVNQIIDSLKNVERAFRQSSAIVAPKVEQVIPIKNEKQKTKTKSGKKSSKK